MMDAVAGVRVRQLVVTTRIIFAERSPRMQTMAGLDPDQADRLVAAVFAAPSDRGNSNVRELGAKPNPHCQEELLVTGLGGSARLCESRLDNHRVKAPGGLDEVASRAGSGNAAPVNYFVPQLAQLLSHAR
jgi:hypothetical protein